MGDARFTDRIGRKAVEKRKLMVCRAERVCLEMGRFEPTDRDSSDQTMPPCREHTTVVGSVTGAALAHVWKTLAGCDGSYEVRN